MKSIYRLIQACSVALALLLLAGPATAGVTSIAQLPLLSIDGTGTVKPNLMLLYDNSGSMAWTFLPDYIDDSSTCRKYLLMASGTQSCAVGHPPFNSADFNKLYYDPKTRYLPPVKADGSSYDSQTSANTTSWTKVKNDGFGIDTSDLRGSTASTTINLVTGFPDLAWCDGYGNNCVYNTATYSYPTDSRYKAASFTTNPYYYDIKAGEYCTTAALTTCTPVAVGATPPAGYSFPAKVRFCNSTALTNCQAKYVGAYVYPRFSTPNAAVVAAYGTITIGASTTANSMTIDSVSVAESATSTVVITNGSITASTGTDTPTKQASVAASIAASIIAKTGLTNQYLACVRTPPNSSSVPACSTYGITLGADNIVAVVPIDCGSNSTGKTIGQCSVLADSTRQGWAISVQQTALVTNVTSLPKGVLSVSGTGKNNGTKLSSLALDGNALFQSTLTFANSVSSKDAAAAIAAQISAPGIYAVQGGGTGCSSANTTVCVFTALSTAANQTFTIPALTNNGSLAITGTKTTAGDAPAYDSIKADTAPIGAGNAIFVRTDIIPARTSYPRDQNRTDCLGATCTYDEEMTNFANWYTYYKTRNQAMKSSVGLAFKPLTENYNIGLVALSVAGVNGAMTRPLPFTGDVRTGWYSSLYGMQVGGSTPLRVALNAVGKMYANQDPYIAAAGQEAVQFPCQQNFTFLTTDGYWNGAAATNVSNNDNVVNPARFCSQITGCYDSRAQTVASLADVALYWYNGGTNGTTVSLRPSLEDMNAPGKVRGATGDNTHLHMNTYTLGLGVDGIMNYEANYDTAPIAGGDFAKLINGTSTGCPWNNNGAYVWPDPATTDSDGGATYQTRVDDLWHAAINGRGKYFSASAPTQVIAGLSAALNNIQAHVGAASASATSTPNITPADNDLFSSTFTTVVWSGELTDKKIDPVTGAIALTTTWNTSDKVGLRVSASSDTRVIKMLDTTNGTLKNFSYDTMSTLEKSWFDNKCSALGQCNNLSVTDKATVNLGATIVNWLRGQQQYANDVVLRAYGKAKSNAAIPVVIGDIASSKPAYVHLPRKAYAIDSYQNWVATATIQGRAPAVYVNANDGMLHAIDGRTGDENWAYVPRITMKKLYAQAGTTYGTNHQFTTDGSPEVGDVQINGVWRTVLVSGLNAGGRGFYALDITDPLNPKALWETCADAAICSGDNNEPEIGQTFSSIQMGTWKDSTGASKWVAFVSSGYNNIPNTDNVAGGTGKGWLMILDIATGKVLAKVSTGSGDTTTPSGFSRFTAISADPVTDPLITYIYGGDVLGQMWRFDVTAGGTPVVLKMADAGTLQPITTRPDLTYCAVNTTASDGTVTTSNKIVVTFGTGRLLDIGDVANTDKQSAYVLRDTGVGITAAQWRSSLMAKRSLAKTTTNGVDVFKISGTAVDLSSQLGWYVDFDQTQGERVNIDPRIQSGTLDIITNIPASSNVCSVGGRSNIYYFDVCAGTGDANGVVGGTLSATSAAVGSTNFGTSGGGGSDGGGGPNNTEVNLADGTQVLLPQPSYADPKTRRVGWRRIRN